MAEMSIEQLADEMHKAVEAAVGSKKYKPGDLIKEMTAKHGTSKDDGKAAIKELLDSERCVYSYAGGSYIELAQ